MPEIKGFKPEGPEEEKPSEAVPKTHRADGPPEIKGFAKKLTDRDLVEAKMRRFKEHGRETSPVVSIKEKLGKFLDLVDTLSAKEKKWVRETARLNGPVIRLEELGDDLGRLLAEISTIPLPSDKDGKFAEAVRKMIDNVYGSASDEPKETPRPQIGFVDARGDFDQEESEGQEKAA